MSCTSAPGWMGIRLGMVWVAWLGWVGGFSGTAGGAEGVGISEFMADNDRTLNDEDGEASDWIELENRTEARVSLAGWGLSDDPGEPAKWVFPAVDLPARGYVVVFASGKNRASTEGPWHTNFRLSKEGGYLGLRDEAGRVVSEFAPAYPRQEEDVSYGRLPTDGAVTGYLSRPTPGAANVEGGPGFAPAVRFSRVGGTFVDPFDLELSTAWEGAVIRYTTNGTVPGESAAEYVRPLRVADSLRVRARAYVPGLLPGPLVGESYVGLHATALARTSNLPLMVLHSFGRGTIPANGEYPAFLTLHEPRGGVASLTNAADLRTRVRLTVRGSSTANLPKRSYRVEFRDEREVDREMEPLGLPAEADWVLYAPNRFEPILMHNPMMYRLSRELGRYAPRTRFVELYLRTSTGPIQGTSYQGIYVLTEKIKRGADRVAIDKLEPEHVRAPEITGGYLLKIDRLDPGDTGLSAGGQLLGYVDPKEEEMETGQRAVQRTYLRNHINAFRSALYGGAFRDPAVGWRAYVDEGSWLDHHLMNVLAFNVDALRLSAYFHKERGGKLVFGPLWDFDRALNSTDGRDLNPRRWRSTTGGGGTDYFNYPWWGRLFQDPDFWQAWIDRYQELRRDQFSTNHLFRLVDELTDQVRAAQPREVARWPGFTTPRGSYQNEINGLKTWLSRRLEFMDTNFLAAPVAEPAGGVISAGAPGMVTLRGPAGASLYYTVDGTDPRATGGAISETALRYSGPLALEGPVTLRVRSYDARHRNLTGANHPPLSSSWSGGVVVRFSGAPGARPGELTLTEVAYRPGVPTALELTRVPWATRSDFEFLEIANRSPHAVDLADLRFTAGVTFAFRTSTIPVLEAGGVLVLVRNRAAFEARYGKGARVAGEFGGGLDAEGEVLRLEDGAGRVVLEENYQSAWYPTTDGLGFTLVTRSKEERAGGDGARAGREVWRPSAAAGGSPGVEEPEAGQEWEVVIDEVLAHPAAGRSDGIELWNSGEAPVDLGGWYLTDDRGMPFKYRIPDGRVLPAGGRMWLDGAIFGSGSGGGTPFGLGASGESVWLFAAGRDGRLLGYAHGVAFGAAPMGVSFGRERGCHGTEGWVAQRAVTPGLANAGPMEATLRISEVHGHPPDIQVGVETWNDTALEFVELANVSGAAVALHELGRPAVTWRLRGSVTFDFPAGVVVPAGGTLLVVNFDPETDPQAASRFQAALNPAPGTPVFGPFQGSLPNRSGTVVLARPDPSLDGAGSGVGTEGLVEVDAVRYDLGVGGSGLAAGTGRSLQRISPLGLGEDPAQWVAASPTPGWLRAEDADADGDGLPDGWEAAHCLDANDANDAGNDDDGDGATHFAEYVARTDPFDAADVLGWRHAERDAEPWALEFEAKAGVGYRVEATEALEGGEWVMVQEVPAGSGDREVRVRETPTATGARYFRVVVTSVAGTGR